MNQTDQELLEQAAKAAGYDLHFATGGGFPPSPWLRESKRDFYWNPLADDGDALRLATKLGFSIHRLINKVGVSQWGGPNYLGGWSEFTIIDTDDAVMRRAIVRAAAEIGAAQ